jgi:4-azaleucine resistance transporter AzlC
VGQKGYFIGKDRLIVRSCSGQDKKRVPNYLPDGKSLSSGKPISEEGCNGPKEMNRFDLVLSGIRAAWPICLGYLPIGFAFGVLAQKAGLDLLDIALMSILVYAGSSQFIAVAMIGSDAAPVSIVLTTFVVNLRHLLMSSSLAVYLHGAGRRFLSVFAYGVTDESFAVNLAKYREGPWHRYQALVVNQVPNFTWICSTIFGGYVGESIPSGSFGIDYALSAMFICLLTFQIRGRLYLLTAIISGVSAIVLSFIVPENSFVIIASLFGATVGFALKRYLQKKRKSYA